MKFLLLFHLHPLWICLGSMLSNPFEKHLSVTRHASMVEGLSHYKVVCFPATILTPLEIVHSVLTCSGITFFLPLRYVVLGETETVIEQASLLELLMTKELLDLSALTRNLQKKDYSALGYYCFIHNQVLSLFL